MDFNHRLAGKTLVYDVEVVSKVESDDQKIRSLIKRRFPGEIGDKVEFTEGEGTVMVKIPEEAFMAEGLQVIKRGISNDVSHFLPAVNKVTFKEVYARKEAAKPAEKPADSAAEAPAPEAPKEEAEQKA